MLRPYGRGGGRDFLDRELHGGQFRFPGRLELGHRQQHQVIKPLGPGPVQRHVGRDQGTSQPAPVPVPPPDVARSTTADAVAVMHSN